MLCAAGPVRDLARLSLAPEFRRGHGALYDGLNARPDVGRLRVAVAGLPLPAWPDGGIRLAVDVSSWLRPEAGTCPERMNCFVYGRGRNPGQMVPGWPYSLVAALGPGPSSWQALLDAVRIGPGDDAAEVTAAQLREVVQRLVAACRWRPGDPAGGHRDGRGLRPGPPVVAAAGPAGHRRRPGPGGPRVLPAAAAREPGGPGAPRLHGPAVRCARDAGAGDAAVTGTGPTSRGPAAVTAWQPAHPVLRRDGGWSAHPRDERLPLVEGTLIRLAPERGEAMWLRASDPLAGQAQVARLWQAYLRRFDVEHCFRFLKQQLGWTAPVLRDPRRGRPVDLARHRRLEPALARPPPRRRDPAAVAARRPGPGPHPGRVRASSAAARSDRGHPRKPPETLLARTRAAQRLEEQAQGTTPARRQTQPETGQTENQGDDGLNDKPKECREESSQWTLALCLIVFDCV